MKSVSFLKCLFFIQAFILVFTTRLFAQTNLDDDFSRAEIIEFLIQKVGSDFFTSKDFSSLTLKEFFIQQAESKFQVSDLADQEIYDALPRILIRYKIESQRQSGAKRDEADRKSQVINSRMAEEEGLSSDTLITSMNEIVKLRSDPESLMKYLNEMNTTDQKGLVYDRNFLSYISYGNLVSLDQEKILEFMMGVAQSSSELLILSKSIGYEIIQKPRLFQRYLKTLSLESLGTKSLCAVQDVVSQSLEALKGLKSEAIVQVQSSLRENQTAFKKMIQNAKSQPLAKCRSSKGNVPLEELLLKMDKRVQSWLSNRYAAGGEDPSLSEIQRSRIQQLSQCDFLEFLEETRKATSNLTIIGYAGSYRDRKGCNYALSIFDRTGSRARVRLEVMGAQIIWTKSFQAQIPEILSKTFEIYKNEISKVSRP